MYVYVPSLRKQSSALQRTAADRASLVRIVVASGAERSRREPNGARKMEIYGYSDKAVVRVTDMTDAMQQDAVDCAAHALGLFDIEMDCAAYIKKEFDKKYERSWHCVVGTDFGTMITHETRTFIYFYIGQIGILLYRSG